MHINPRLKRFPVSLPPLTSLVQESQDFYIQNEKLQGLGLFTVVFPSCLDLPTRSSHADHPIPQIPTSDLGVPNYFWENTYLPHHIVFFLSTLGWNCSTSKQIIKSLKLAGVLNE